MAEEGKPQSLHLKQKVSAPKTSTSSGVPAAKDSLGSIGADMDSGLNVAKAIVQTLFNPLAAGKLVLTVLPEDQRSAPMKAAASFFSGLGQMLSPLKGGSAPKPQGLLKAFQGAADGPVNGGLNRVAQGGEKLLDKGGSLAIKGGQAMTKKGAALSSTVLGSIIGIPLMIGGVAATATGGTAKGAALATKGTRKLLATARRTIRVTGKTFRAIRASVTQARRSAKRLIRRPLAPVRVRLKLASRKVKAVRRRVQAFDQKVRRYTRLLTAPGKVAFHLAKSLHHRAEATKAHLLGDESGAAAHGAKVKAGLTRAKGTVSTFKKDLAALRGKKGPGTLRLKFARLLSGPAKAIQRTRRRIAATLPVRAVKAAFRPVIATAAKGKRIASRVSKSRVAQALGRKAIAGGRKVVTAFRGHQAQFKASAKQATGAPPYQFKPDEIVAIQSHLSVRIF